MLMTIMVLKYCLPGWVGCGVTYLLCNYQIIIYGNIDPMTFIQGCAFNIKQIVHLFLFIQKLC